MQFSDSIPENVLQHSNARAFVRVLDELNSAKKSIITKSIRQGNPILCTDKMWLCRYLRDYGFKFISEKMPLEALQQLALNAELVFGLRGSLAGLCVLCNAYTFGFVEVSITDFTKPFNFLMPNSTLDGFITNSNDGVTYRYLIDTNELNAPRSMDILISGGDTDEEVRSLLALAIDNYVGFHPNCTFNIEYTTGKFDIEKVYDDKLNLSFINHGSYVYTQKAAGEEITIDDIRQI